MENILKVLKRCIGKSIVLIILFILNTFATYKMVYALSLLSGIETFVRMLVIIILVLLWIGFSLTYIKKLFKRKSKYLRYIPITIVYVTILFVGSNYIIKTYKVIDRLSSSTTLYSSSLITLVENESYKIDNIGSGKIGIISDYTSIDGNEIPKEVIENKKIKNKIKEYDSYVKLLDALYEKEVDYIFLPTNYIQMFLNINDEEYETLEDDTKIIFTEEKEVKRENNNKIDLSKPFSVLIMGVDSKEESLKNSAFNGDALILLTFNPKTLNTTIMSIPRDSYVPIACFKNKTKNKITHAAMYGEECMIKTIENFTSIDINYYVKINFKGVVKIIDELDGIEVEVPYSFCEQDSNRKWGKNTIYVEEGLQTLNGEQALALSRNRKNNTSKCSSKWTSGYRSDFVRGQNQQLVLRSTLNKLKEIKDLNEIYNLLDTVSDSMETNMTTNEILSLYNIAKDILVKSSNSNMEDLIGFKRLYLSGEDARIYDSRTGLNLYNYVLYDGSIKDVSEAMQINLEKKEPKLIKEFTFDINEEYEEKIIGKGNYESSIVKLPSFVGKTESEAKSKAKKLGLDVTIKYMEGKSSLEGTVLYQNYGAGTNVLNVSNLILTVVKNDNIADNNTDKEENNTEKKKEDVEEKDNVNLDDITGITGIE